MLQCAVELHQYSRLFQRDSVCLCVHLAQSKIQTTDIAVSGALDIALKVRSFSSITTHINLSCAVDAQSVCDSWISYHSYVFVKGSGDTYLYPFILLPALQSVCPGRSIITIVFSFNFFCSFYCFCWTYIRQSYAKPSQDLSVLCGVLWQCAVASSYRTWLLHRGLKAAPSLKESWKFRYSAAVSTWLRPMCNHWSVISQFCFRSVCRYSFSARKWIVIFLGLAAIYKPLCICCQLVM